MAFFASTPRVRVGIPGIICALLLPLLFPSAAQPQGIQGRRLDDIYIVAQFNDGYWEWYYQYLQNRDEQRRRITEIRLQLAVLAAERKKLRADWLKLLYSENQLTPKTEYNAAWVPFWAAAALNASGSPITIPDEITGVSSPGELAGELRREVDDIAFRWSAGLWGAPLVSDRTESTDSATLEATYQGQRDLLRTAINDWKDVQGGLIKQALALNRDLSASCLAQKEKSGNRRPWLNAETERLDDERTILEVYLYDAAEWYLPDELPKLIEALDLDNTATEEVAALLRAKVALHNAAWNDEKNWLQMTSPRQAPPDPEWVMAARRPRLEAIVNLRRVIELNPENTEARGMLMEVELYWLREIAAKVDLESRASLEAFRQYLTARGFYADQPQGWFQPAFDVISAIWGLGPIALTAGLPGLNVAEARAIELDTTQTAAARNQVSLLAIMRLVKNGVSLIEIPSMTPREVATRMTMHTAEGRPLPPDKASRVVQDIRGTFGDLKDLHLLASADPQYLVEDVNNAFGKVYYAPLDPTYTWYESVGDLLNIHNVALLWGPGSITKIDGKWATSGLMSATELQAMEQAGRVVTGKQAFVAGLRLDKLAETIAGTRVGARFGAALAADRAAMASRGPAMNLANMGARLASAMVLYSGATYLGTEAGIPGIGLLVEVIGELGPVGMLSDIAVRGQVPLEELATRVDEFGGFVTRQSDELSTAQARSAEVSGYAEEMAEGTIDVQRQATIKNRLNEIVEETGEATRPPGAAAAPVDEAVGSAARALLNDDVVEAREALAGAAELAESASTRLDEAAAKVAAVQAMLREAAQHPSLVIQRPEELKKLYEMWALPKYWRSDLYADAGAGLSLKLADEAQRQGDLAGAFEHLREARREILAVRRTAANAPQVDELTRHISQRLDEVVNAGEEFLRMQRMQSAVPPSNASDAIDEAQAMQALEHLDELEAAGTTARGSANPVLPVQDEAGNWYFAKRIVPDDKNPLTQGLTPPEIEEILTGEAASYSLVKEVAEIERSRAPTPDGSMPGDLGGLNAPAARYDPARGVLLTRAVPREAVGLAGELWELPEHVFIAYRKEYARQRVLRAWLGDPDGHARNMFRGDDARLYQLDFDQACLNGKESRLLPGPDDDSVEGAMRYMLTLPARVSSSRNGALFRIVSRMDQEITYADMASTVAAIRDLVARPGELSAILEKAGYPHVNTAVQTLTERASLLEPVLKSLFDGELLRIGVAWIPRHVDGWLARLPSRPLRHLFTVPGRPARAPTWQIESLPRAA